MEPEQLLHDVSLEREHRRSQQGYSTPGDARAFLQMARQPRRQGPAGCPRSTRSLLHTSEPSVEAAASADRVRNSQGAPWNRQRAPMSPSQSTPSLTLLAEAGLVPERPRALLEGTAPQPPRLTEMRR